MYKGATNYKLLGACVATGSPNVVCESHQTTDSGTPLSGMVLQLGLLPTSDITFIIRIITLL